MLDQIIRRLFISTPETVNSNWASPSVSLDSIQDELSVSLKYENGVDVDMSVYLAFSNDNINFARDNNTLATIVDSDGYILRDFAGSGVQFARWEIEVIAGSIDIVDASLVGKRDH